MKIVVVFGGKSVEHEISIISAFQVIEALSVEHKVYPVYITRDNKFYYDKSMKDIEYFKSKKRNFKKENIRFFKKKDRCYFRGRKKHYFDMIFPIVHGKGSEDGSVLNYFRFEGFPVVGTDVGFYQIAQNKALSKRVLDGLGIDNVGYKIIKRGDNYCKKDFRFPCIVKPNNLGSSLGISVAYDYIELEKAISLCFKIDNEVLVEAYLSGCKEYNIAVLNNSGEIEVSEIEEVVKGEIFSFEDKYLSGNKKSGLASQNRKRQSAIVDKDLQMSIENVAKKIYKEFGASGVVRIDFLYKDKLYVNEINAIPGSYAYYLWDNKYDFLELLNIVLKEAKRANFFLSKTNDLLYKKVIFK